MIDEILKKITTLKVAVIGDIMLDAYTHGSVERISPEAPVPVMNVSNEDYRPGGAANVALNTASLGAGTVCLGGIYGEDSSAKTLREILAKNGCQLDAKWGLPTARTITKRRFVSGRAQMLRVDIEDAPKTYAIDLRRDTKALSQSLLKADVVILSDYAKGTLSSEVLSVIQKVCQKQGSVMSVGLKPKNNLEFKGATLVTLNRKEALELSGLSVQRGEVFPAAAVCERLYARYAPKYLVVTLGEEGMIVSSEGRVSGQIPTFAREVYDVSGAGDTVIAALSCALAVGAGIIDAARLANLAAGVVVGKAGTATATPREIIDLMKLIALSGLSWEPRVEQKISETAKV